MTALDISSLGNAIKQLRAGIEILNADPDNQLYRDGVLQRFEFTYGLCHKMLLRFLEQNSPNPEEVEQMTLAALIRTGARSVEVGVGRMEALSRGKKSDQPHVQSGQSRRSLADYPTFPRGGGIPL